MPRQAGYFEWDDAELTPGQKREGGWHQNLYDADGALQGHGRFVPTDERFDLDDDVPPTSYIQTDQRSESDEAFDLTAFIAGLVTAYLIDKGASYAAPHVKRWWDQSAQPFVVAQAEKVTGLFRRHTDTEGRSDKTSDNLAWPNLELPATNHRPGHVQCRSPGSIPCRHGRPQLQPGAASSRRADSHRRHRRRERHPPKASRRPARTVHRHHRTLRLQPCTPPG